MRGPCLIPSWPAALLVVASLSLAACGEGPAAPPSATPAAPAPPVQEPPATSRCVIKIVPGEPRSSDCVTALIERQPPNSRVIWSVNGRPTDKLESNKLFPDSFQRGDKVDIRIEGEQGVLASASATIGNGPPAITGITSTPEQVFAGSDLQVVPKGEDRDGDSVEFRYQWLINGAADPFLTTNVLPGSRFKKGDTIQVRITPFDGIDEGPVYESYRMTIPNAPPRIESTPPAQFEALAYSYQAKAVDPDGDSLAWRLDSAPQGMTIDPGSGLITWPLAGVQPGSYPLKIVVRDPDGAEAFQEFSLTLGTPK